MTDDVTARTAESAFWSSWPLLFVNFSSSKSSGFVSQPEKSKDEIGIFAQKTFFNVKTLRRDI
jgi:hypothetical protein